MPASAIGLLADVRNGAAPDQDYTFVSDIVTLWKYMSYQRPDPDEFWRVSWIKNLKVGAAS